MYNRNRFKVIDDSNCVVKFYQSLKPCYKYAEKCNCGEIRYWCGRDTASDIDGTWRLHAVISKGVVHVVRDTNVYAD